MCIKMDRQPAENKDFRHIVRISNTDLDGSKHVVDALRKIKGIGFSFASAVCVSSGVDRFVRIGDLKDEDIKKIADTIASAPSKFPHWLLNRRRDAEEPAPRHLVTTDLSFANESDLRLMKLIRSYKGVRHMTGSPVRGQRTRSNFRRNKGKVLGVAKVKQTGTKGK